MKVLFTLLSTGLLLLLFQFYSHGQAPCPAAPTCMPGLASTPVSAFGAGITSVQLGSVINKTSGNYIEGYQDFSCIDSATVTAGSNISVAINTSTVIDENVRIWIDYNNNNIFESPQELVFSSNAQKVHTGSFTVSSTAVKNAYLRVRVASDAFNAPAPTPCSTPLFSQTEDYSLRLISSTSAPVADFVAGPTYTCNGVVNFTDQSLNVPFSWEWTFGDGSPKSNVPSPTHTYTTSGVYTVKLIVGNGIGFDTLTKINYITFNDTIPKAVSCQPLTLAACCGYGITNFKLGDIDHTTGDGSEGYGDFTCEQRTDLLIGKNYLLSMLTGALAQDVRIWLDTNNNGSFEANELLVELLDTVNPEVVLNIPFSQHIDTALRMRIMADFEGTPFGPCTNLTHGQAEDYTIVLKENTLPPVADFTLVGEPVTNILLSCGLTVNFDNLTDNAVTSYLWNFGDINTSSLANPTHTYAASGSYTVQLVVQGPFGNDTISKILNIGLQPVANCVVSSTGGNFFGIKNVTFNTINNSSIGAPAGYQDFTCEEFTVVLSGQTYPINVEVSTNFEDAAVWIDFDNNGVFSLSEQAFLSTAVPASLVHTGNVFIPGTALSGQPLRMRVLSDNGITTTTDPCGSFLNAQVEDYTVVIQPDSTAPVADFDIDSSTFCSGNVQFLNRTTGLATSFRWTFGVGGIISTNINPIEPLTGGSYDIELIAYGPLGNDTIIKTLVIPGSLVATCAAPTSNAGPQDGIERVQFSNLDHTSSDAGSEGYQDFTCLPSANVVQGQTYTLAVTPIFLDDPAAAWIDYNNDGVFTVAERILAPATPINNTVSVTIPNNAVTNTRLRMRVIVDFPFYNPADGACYTIDQGQAEDYSVVVSANNITPVADFNFVQDCSGEVSFTNASTGGITGYEWTFGTLGTSAATDTSFVMASGTYSVQLIAFGNLVNDTITKTITVTPPTIPPGLKPIPVGCVPTVGVPSANGGIKRVQLITIDNSTSHALDDGGYNDFTCLADTLTAGQTYTLTVETFSNPSVLKVWIDYNDDGILAVSEQVIGAVNFGGTIFTETFTVPDLALTGKSLRMRVFSETGTFVNSGLGSCYAFFDGQAEDYTLMIEPNTMAPVANFTFDVSPCNGQVVFKNTSTGGIAGYSWNFAGLGNSSAINTAFTFAPGSYNVQLVTVGTTVNDTVSQTIVVPAAGAGPTPIANCAAPTSVAFVTPNHGIARVTLGNINNISEDASTEGYQDFTCLAPDTLNIDLNYTLSVEVFSNIDQMVAWIDYNNNGLFEDIESLNAIPTPSIGNVYNQIFTVPATATTIVPLRMRILTEKDFHSPLDGACYTIRDGQAEDYTVVILPNNAPPVAGFSFATTLCGYEVSFTNLSTGNATGTNLTGYVWDFDGLSTSTATNPTFTFPNSGTYTVTLVAIGNAFSGNDTITQTIILGPTGSSGPIPTSCLAPTDLTTVFGFEGITRVDFNTIGHVSMGASNTNGYEDFTCSVNTNVIAGQTYQLEVGTANFGFNDDVAAWIDYNNDGQFTLSERVMLQTTPSGGPPTFKEDVIIPLTAVQNTALRMRVIGQSPSYNPANGACYTITGGQAEDYSVTIQDPLRLRDLAVQQGIELSVYPNPTSGLLTVAFTKAISSQATVLVRDLTGREIMRQAIRHGQQGASTQSTRPACRNVFAHHHLGEQRK